MLQLRENEASRGDAAAAEAAALAVGPSRRPFGTGGPSLFAAPPHLSTLASGSASAAAAALGGEPALPSLPLGGGGDSESSASVSLLRSELAALSREVSAIGALLELGGVVIGGQLQRADAPPHTGLPDGLSSPGGVAAAAPGLRWPSSHAASSAGAVPIPLSAATAVSSLRGTVVALQERLYELEALTARLRSELKAARSDALAGKDGLLRCAAGLRQGDAAREALGERVAELETAFRIVAPLAFNLPPSSLVGASAAAFDAAGTPPMRHQLLQQQQGQQQRRRHRADAQNGDGGRDFDNGEDDDGETHPSLIEASSSSSGAKVRRSASGGGGVVRKGGGIAPPTAPSLLVSVPSFPSAGLKLRHSTDKPDGGISTAGVGGGNSFGGDSDDGADHPAPAAAAAAGAADSGAAAAAPGYSSWASSRTAIAASVAHLPSAVDIPLRQKYSILSSDPLPASSPKLPKASAPGQMQAAQHRTTPAAAAAPPKWRSTQTQFNE